MYLVMALKENLDVLVYGVKQKAPLSYADGMVGAMPIFETLEQAEAYSNGRHKIIEVTEIKRKPSLRIIK